MKPSWNLHEAFVLWNLLWTWKRWAELCIVNYACCCNTIWFLWSVGPVGSNFWREELSLRILSALELDISLLPKAWELQNHLPTCWSKWHGRFGGNQGLVAASHSDQPASHCANSRVPEIHGGFFWIFFGEVFLKKMRFLILGCWLAEFTLSASFGSGSPWMESLQRWFRCLGLVGAIPTAGVRAVGHLCHVRLGNLSEMHCWC